MANIVANSYLTKLGEDLECPLCIELFRDPRSLQCLHTFCHGCLQKYLERQRVKTSLDCPVCRETTRIPTGDIGILKPNLVVNRLAETWSQVQNAGTKDPAVSATQGRIDAPQEGARCPSHSNEVLTQYCCACKVSICRDCIIGDHRNHTIETLDAAVIKMKQDIKWATEVTGSFIPKLQSVRSKIAEAERTKGSFAEAAAALEKEITLEAESALALVTDAIRRKRDTQLAVVTALRKVSSGELMEQLSVNAIRNLNIADRVTGEQCLSLAEVADIYPELRRRLGLMVDSCIDGGLLDNIGSLSAPSFRPNEQVLEQVTFGRLDHPRAWRLTRTFTLPQRRIGEFFRMRALSDGKLAIGYRNGGIDVFDPINAGELKDLLPDVPIRDFAIFKSGSILVVSLGNTLHLYDPNGEKRDVTFNTPPTSGLMSVDVDEENNIIVGFSEHKSIHLYDKNGGNPTQVIDLKDFDPWHVFATTMGKIVCKNLNSVKVFDRSGKVRATISESPPLCTFTTGDSTGHLFVLVLRKLKKISIARHKYDGSLEQTITKEQEVFKINEEKYWFGLAALSPSCLAVSDTRNIFIYRNAPVLPDLLKLAK